MFEWDSANAQHIIEHGVYPPEAQQAIDDPHALALPANDVAGEERLLCLVKPREDGSCLSFTPGVALGGESSPPIPPTRVSVVHTTSGGPESV